MRKHFSKAPNRWQDCKKGLGLVKKDKKDSQVNRKTGISLTVFYLCNACLVLAIVSTAATSSCQPEQPPLVSSDESFPLSDFLVLVPGAVN